MNSLYKSIQENYDNIESVDVHCDECGFNIVKTWASPTNGVSHLYSVIEGEIYIHNQTSNHESFSCDLNLRPSIIEGIDVEIEISERSEENVA